MKPILYYTLTRPSFYTRSNYDVLGVTSEGPRGRINGRYSDGHPTHTNVRYTTGKFDNEATARSKIDMIKAAQVRCEKACKPHNDAIERFHKAERAEIDAICASIPK